MKKPLFIITLLVIFTLGLQAQNNTELFFVFLNTKSDKVELTKDSVEKIQKAHLANIERLYIAGKIIAAGPFEGGGGLFIFKTSSLKETQNLLNTDPGIKAKRWNIEVFPLSFVVGKIGEIPEKYAMATYAFIRYSNKTKREAVTNNKENILLAHGDFGKKNGGFIVLKTADLEEAKKIATKDLLPNFTDIEFTIKKLWIAEGTFVFTILDQAQ